jgi:hypothetical protein
MNLCIALRDLCRSHDVIASIVTPASPTPLHVLHNRCFAALDRLNLAPEARMKLHHRWIEVISKRLSPPS